MCILTYSKVKGAGFNDQLALSQLTKIIKSCSLQMYQCEEKAIHSILVCVI